MANLLQFSTCEANANVILSREVSRLQRREMAAYMIQMWWLRRKPSGDNKSKKAGTLNMMHLALQLKQLKLDACREIDDAAGFSAKIDHSHKQLKTSERIMSDIGYLLWHDEYV